MTRIRPVVTHRAMNRSTDQLVLRLAVSGRGDQLVTPLTAPTQPAFDLDEQSFR